MAMIIFGEKACRRDAIGAGRLNPRTRRHFDEQLEWVFRATSTLIHELIERFPCTWKTILPMMLWTAWALNILMIFVGCIPASLSVKRASCTPALCRRSHDLPGGDSFCICGRSRTCHKRTAPGRNPYYDSS